MTATLSHNPAATGPSLLRQSRDFCRRITRRQARNFYYGLKLLPEPKRSAMYTLYAYMRLIDDIADDDANQRTLEQRKTDLDEWQHLTTAAIHGQSPVNPAGNQKSKIKNQNSLWPAFIDTVRTYKIPQRIFDDMVDGQRQDLQFTPIETAEDLYRYCYRVASVVGIASLYVWGFDGGDDTLKLAADRGIAFQLTNVLRDLREDAARDRCYLPAADLARFHITPQQIASDKALANRPEFLALMRYQIDRARDFYDRSAPLASRIQPDARPTLNAMTAIYRGILEKIAAHPAQVLRRRVRLSPLAKLLIAWRATHSR